MTTWLFGDFVLENEDLLLLGENPYSLAVKGTALEFAYQRFNIARRKIEKNDVVVVTLTDFDRRWFFKQYPEYAYLDASPNDNKKENKAIKLFRKYLDHKEIHQVYLIDFLFNLHSLTEELELHTIVIPHYNDVETFLESKKDLFPLFNISQGCLNDVEFNKTLIMNELVNNVKNRNPIVFKK